MTDISPVSVKLIDMMDSREYAWKISRPWHNHDDIDMIDIGKMDFSLNSMQVFTFKITSSNIFRDLMFSLRPIEGWAVTSRTQPFTNDTLKMSEEFAGIDNRIDEAIAREHKGESRAKLRGILPVGLSTTFTIMIDRRMLISFCKSIYQLNFDLFSLYCIPMLREAGLRMEFSEATMKPAHIFTQIRDEEMIHGFEQVGGFIIGHYNIKAALASQFIRQHYSKIKIGYWNMVEDYFNIDMVQNDKIDVTFCIDSAAYENLMRIRSSWLIDWSHDMWGQFVSDYIQNMTTEEFWEFIPDTKDFSDEIMNRVNRKDDELPCPIFCEWKNILIARRKEIGESPIIDKYLDLFDEGYVKDNMDNPHRKTFLKLGGRL